MNYERIYMSLVTRAQGRELDVYTERHHIKPKCMGGDNSISNLVNLTPEEHYVAHQLLVKMFPTNFRLITAAVRMCSSTQHVRRSNKLYGWLRRRQSIACSGANHWLNRDLEAREHNQRYMRSEKNPQRKNPRSGEKHHFFGKKNPFIFSDSAKAKLAETKMGHKNPYYGQWGWRHPTCSGPSKEVWKIAVQIRDLHLQQPRWGYSKISQALKLDRPYRAAGVLAKIKEGWDPIQDKDWLTWMCYE